jgi:hypothetical protein
MIVAIGASSLLGDCGQVLVLEQYAFGQSSGLREGVIVFDFRGLI